MNFDYYLFDLDNSLLYIPNPGEYFDGVLVESIKSLSSRSVPIFEERYKFWFSGNDYINLLKSWGVSDIPNFWKKFDEIDFISRKKLRENNRLQLFQDVKPVIIKLYEADKKTAIVSNTADYIVDYILDEFDITHLFHEKFGLGFDKDQEVAKPSPEGILTVLKNLGYTKRNPAIMIGDSFVDIFAAKQANITSCLIKRDPNKYPNGYDNWDYNPDYTIFNLEELLHL
ncbi:MAG: HAD family hydrolase [Promethearchaeota archaeon]